MQGLGIVLGCIAAAVVYGIAQDLITARICIEYFTIGHAPLFETLDPTHLGVLWGIVGSWWVGALLGALIAIAARWGRQPKRPARELARPVAWLLAVMAGSSACAGAAGWLAACGGTVALVGPLASSVPADRHVTFIAVLWAQTASYATGLLVGLLLAIRVWRSRGRG
jgi:hypothetical protein